MAAFFIAMSLLSKPNDPSHLRRLPLRLTSGAAPDSALPLLLLGNVCQRDLRQVLLGVGRSRVEGEFAKQPNRALVIPAPLHDKRLVDQKDALRLGVRVRGQPLLDSG